MKATSIVTSVLLSLTLILAACGPEQNENNEGTSSAGTSVGTPFDMTGTPSGADMTAEASGTSEVGIPNTGNGTQTAGTSTSSVGNTNGNANGNTNGNTNGNSNSNGTQTAGTSMPSASRTPAASVTINVAQDATLGSHLVDGQGMTLYLFAEDTAGSSTCYNDCADEWPPLVTTGAAQAGTGVDASKLGTTMRTDGTTQVTYNGWPLYYFKDDMQTGDVNGQAKDNFFLVSPAGDKISQ